MTFAKAPGWESRPIQDLVLFPNHSPWLREGNNLSACSSLLGFCIWQTLMRGLQLFQQIPLESQKPILCNRQAANYLFVFYFAMLVKMGQKLLLLSQNSNSGSLHFYRLNWVQLLHSRLSLLVLLAPRVDPLRALRTQSSCCRDLWGFDSFSISSSLF